MSYEITNGYTKNDEQIAPANGSNIIMSKVKSFSQFNSVTK